MLEYILKSGSCLVVLFCFYKLFMEGESFHGIKRVYLLMALVISMILPMITITYSTEVPSPEVGSITNFSKIQTNQQASTAAEWREYVPLILIVGYIMGFGIFAFRFLKNLRSLILETKRNDRIRQFNYIYVLLGRKLAPHSFFSYIFLNKNEYMNQEIATAVIEHEKAHVDQKHSLDLLLFEVLHVIFWFNPVFIYLKKSVKLNHEFLADSSVIKKNYNRLDYSNILFHYSSGYHHNALSSPISHSLIKKRIIMITKSFSLRRLLLRSFIFLPVLGICIYFFNEKIVAKPLRENMNPVSEISAVNQIRTIYIKVENENIWLNEKKVSLDDFTEAMDKLTSNWSQEELEKPWFEIDFQNSTTEFIEKLNNEYRKTRLSKISETEFLAPSPAVPGQTPPPPPPPPVKKRENQVPPPAPSSSEKYVQRDNLFSISITGNTLKVDGKEIKPKNFAKTLNKLSEGKTDEELKHYNFRMHISDPKNGFMKELNQEFKKSRISKVTGHEILPPPPPKAPHPPEVGSRRNIESKQREKIIEEREIAENSRSRIIEEQKNIEEVRQEIREERENTQKVQKEVLRERELMNDKMEKTRKEPQNLERDMQGFPASPKAPAPPDPLDSIEELEKEGGSFYFNKKKISAAQAKEYVKNKEYLKIKIIQTGNSNGKMEISGK